MCLLCIGFILIVPYSALPEFVSLVDLHGVWSSYARVSGYVHYLCVFKHSVHSVFSVSCIVNVWLWVIFCEILLRVPFIDLSLKTVFVSLLLLCELYNSHKLQDCAGSSHWTCSVSLWGAVAVLYFPLSSAPVISLSSSDTHTGGQMYCSSSSQ